MQPIETTLQELDSLYCTGSLPQYEEAIQTAEQQVKKLLPGFTIAYAEIATAGQERYPHGGMRHVLLPLERNY